MAAQTNWETYNFTFSDNELHVLMSFYHIKENKSNLKIKFT